MLPNFGAIHAYIHTCPYIHTYITFDMAMECDNVSDKSLELCLSVTDIYHAKRIIEALYEQKRFEKNLFGPMIGLFDQNVHIGPQYRVYLMLMMRTKLCGLLKQQKLCYLKKKDHMMIMD